MPGTPLSWTLAFLSALILGAGAYAASGPVREFIGYGLPGPGAPGPTEVTNPAEADGGSEGAYSLFRSHVPGGGGEEIGQTRTADGAKVTLQWAYADAKAVVVGYTVEDLEGGGASANTRPSCSLSSSWMGPTQRSSPTAASGSPTRAARSSGWSRAEGRPLRDRKT